LAWWLVLTNGAFSITLLKFTDNAALTGRKQVTASPSFVRF